MTRDPELERALKDVAAFLSDEGRKQWRVDLQRSVGNIASQVLQYGVSMESGFGRMDIELKGIKEKQDEFSRRLQRVEENCDACEETTGMHRLADLRTRADSERAKANVWKTWTLGILGSLLVLLLAGGFTLVVRALVR